MGVLGFGGLTFDKIFLVLVIALVILGPDKLPGYAQKLGQFVRSAKRMADGAKDRLRDEMWPEARAEERKEKAAAAAQARRARLAGASEGDNVEIVRSGTQTFCFDEEAT